MAKKKSAKQSSKKGGLRLKSRLTSWRGIVVIIAVIIVGTIAIFAFAASPSGNAYNQPKGTLDVGYVHAVPTTITQTATGSLTNITSGQSVSVSKAGTLYCTPENSVTTTSTQLSAADFASVHSRVLSTKVNTLADNISTNSSAYVGDYDGITINNNNAIKHTFVYNSQLETPAFKQAKSDLVGLCPKATQAVPASQVPDFTASAPVKKKSLIDSFASWVTPLAYAATPTVDTNSAAADQTSLNNTRLAYGLPKMYRSPCLNSVADVWASTVAAAGKISDPPPGFLVNNINYYCGTFVGTAGANTGSGGSDGAIFTGYMGDAGHRDHILGNFAFVGYADYDIPYGTSTEVFNSQIFLSCSTCGNAAQSSN